MTLLFALVLAHAEVPGALPALERPPEVEVTPEGDLYARAPDGSLARLPHAALVAVEAHCDATTCDLVLRAADRRVAIGPHPRAAAVPGPILALSVELSEGRLDGAAPRRTGELTADVTVRPPSPPPAAVAAATPAPAPPAPTPAPAPPTPTPAPAPPTPDGTATVPPVKLGTLEKSAIDEVIQRNMAQVRYCYQRSLADNPTLAGNVTVKFVIAADGTVSSATVKTSTMPDPAVETCVLGRFMRFVFPPPKGGGIVIVSYPFVFVP